jgi:histidyl-tRNA synthetase
VIGSDSLMNEVELVQIIHDIFKNLKVKVVTKLNNRKILAGMAEIAGVPERFTDLTVALDKLDKIGLVKVREELISKGFSEDEFMKLNPFLDLRGDFREKTAILRSHLEGSFQGMTGIEEMQAIFERLEILGIEEECELDITLARGLNYYTGTIFEVKAKDVEIGSVCGGGRYDDLTGVFGLPGVSGVGISFGADRIYDVLLALNRFPENEVSTTRVLFVNFGDKEEKYCLQLAAQLRESGIVTEIYPDPGKMKKQLKYAYQKQIPYVVLVGEDEISKGMLTVKSMKSGEQTPMTVEQLILLAGEK